jgi:hypothetical protein
MAAVEHQAGSSVDPDSSLKAARSVEAQKLLDMLDAAKPVSPDAFVPGVGMPGGADVPKPHGLYTNALIGPDVWPTESEADLKNVAEQLANLGQLHEQASSSATRVTQNVFSQYWTAGDSASAADDHYQRERLIHEKLADACSFIGGAYQRLSGHVGSIKRKMRDAHDDAHREIEASLKANRGQPVGVGPIVTKYRTLITGYQTELHGFVSDEVTMLGNQFKLAPPEPGAREGGHGTQGDQADGDNHPDGNSPQGEPSGEGAGGRGYGADPGGDPVEAPVVAGPMPVHAIGSDPGPGRPPQIPQMPQIPSPGTGSSPLSGAASSGMGPLSSLLGGGNPATSATGATSGLANSATSAANPTAAQSQAISKAMSSAMGGEFGRGLAAGANAAGSIGPAAQPIPQTPTTPLAAPPAAGTTPASAAPASASMPPPLSAAAPATSTGMPVSAAAPVSGGGATAPMTPYGSVLPPAAGGGGGAGGAISQPPLSSPAPSVTSGGAVPPAGPPPSFVPAVRESAPRTPISRDLSITDLESARAAVADLAAASSAVYPGLQWAVVVARGASGIPEMWLTSNEGAGYIPPGVHVPRAMPLAAGMDADFDARWFGWSNPAETVLRAIQARGDAVSAIATTWPQESDMVREACEDVAIGVAQSGDPNEAEASTLTRGRSHRLETVDPALYHELQQADRAVVDSYVRQLTQQVAFGDGPELSATAQSIAKSLISGRWPTDAEWAALRSEYDWARLMAGSQRPGLIGVEEPTQLLNYQADFVMCRRLETLVCWQDNGPADVVYAARAAGVVLPLVTQV